MTPTSYKESILLSTFKISLVLKGHEKVLHCDVKVDTRTSDVSSLAFNYPTWTSVRHSYSRRRAKALGPHSNDPYEIHESLQLTKIGSIKLMLQKQISENDM